MSIKPADVLGDIINADYYGDRQGQQLIMNAKVANERWERRAAVRLSALVGDEAFYPLLTLCKLGHSIGQIGQAVGKAALILILRAGSHPGAGQPQDGAQ
ncbi:hypothetical protein [Mycobacterium heckeshornense]|uniref:hypothetical protein n=1 Tax=Mycobacterium heckeshornense TaxID=110505 RepID=UPI0006626A29|nr:hypothetical protein [Mycobacterium heckeshornense]KMV23361.1 hypothetical protein ACT16_06780 [Mycobacterium heckeshornense]